MLYIICALKHEARPVIEYYNLAHEGSALKHPVYINNEHGIFLAVSGTGMKSAADCVNSIYERYDVLESDAWLNIGIAGHKDLEPGTPVLAAKITDVENNATWTMRIPFATYLITGNVSTLNTPSSNYDDKYYDMEAAGFYREAIRISDPENIYCLKIVSDNAENSTRRISGKFVRELVNKNLGEIDTLISKIKACTGKAL